jgi:IS5 family transposase
VDRGKSGSKWSIVAGGRGVPLGAALGAGNTRDVKLLEETLENRLAEDGEGRANLCGDAGYASKESDNVIIANGYVPRIVSRADEKADLERNPDKKARRRVVERTHSWMASFRKAATRYEKKAENHMGPRMLVFAHIAFKQAGMI